MHHDRRPITLDIFDFDSTLFLSPLLSCNLWHSSFVNSITQENLLGPGWWRDIRSLMVAGTWSNYWNEDVVQKVKESSADPLRMTVLLTGRRYYPFHTLIESMLASRGLQFDLIGLRPDPITDGPDHPTGLMFNDEPDVFDTTMDFKTSFIVNTLNSIPSLKEIVMWDDRKSHICVFKLYLEDMVEKGIIEKGHIVCVKPSKPKYNPTWEIETVNEMIKTHNDAVLTMRQNNQKIENRVTIQNLDQSFTSCDLYKLQKINSHITLQLSQETQDYLFKLFSPMYTACNKSEQAEWEIHNAEHPVYFGNEVLLVVNEQDKKELLKTQFDIDIGQQVSFQVVQRSQISCESGLALRVKLSVSDEHFFILPLWYKPSEFNTLIAQNFDWQDIDTTVNTLQGTVGYHQLNILHAYQ